MTIDGFLQFLGLIVAVYALFGVVIRFRLRLLGWWLWLPTASAFLTSVYLLLFDMLGAACGSRWCAALTFQPGAALTPNKLAFIVVLAWLIYVALLPRWKSIGARHLPLLSALVDRLVAEKRFPELVDFIEPHVRVISRCAQRQFPLQRLRDSVRWQHSPFAALAKQAAPEPSRLQRAKDKLIGWALAALKPIEARLPQTSARQEAAQRILRVLYTNQPLMEFIALERSLFALGLMDLGSHDYDFGDRAFEMMMSHPQSQLRRETLLNQNTGLCFYEIDPKNPLINALFASAKVAERLEVYRPVGDYPLRLLQRDQEYRQIISSSKPQDDHIIHLDPTYIMIRFFDIMVRSAMRDGIAWHMWLLYFDIIVGRLIKAMDHKHPEYEKSAEFPNFGYYLVYEIFSTYGGWLRAIECCPEDSVVVRIDSVAPVHENGSILKTTMLSIGNSLKHLLVNEDTNDDVITYLLGMLMRYYRDLANRPNGGAKAQEALRNAILNGGFYDLQPLHIARLGDCYAQIDPLLRFETPEFGEAIAAKLQ